jgi:hypothetical protein
MPDYMLLLHERPDRFANLASDEMQRVVAKYVEWRTTLATQGKLTGGQKLRAEGGRIITSPAGGEVQVKDGPFTETKDIIGGYFIINASDYDEAVAIASSCPHLLYDGRIELREVEPVRRG